MMHLDHCAPYCPVRVGGDHEITCEAVLAEVWCERCDQPTDRVVTTSSGDHPLCIAHAAMLEFQIGSRNFNGGGR